MISCPESSWTLKRVSGRASSTSPSNCISSSFAIQRSFGRGRDRTRRSAGPETVRRTKRPLRGTALQSLKSAGPGFAPSRSRGLEVDRRGLAVALVGLELVGDLLTLAQAHQARALHRRDVDEDILAAVVRLDEAVALRLVEPLHRTRFHGLSSSVYARGRPARRDPPGSSSFWKGSPERALQGGAQSEAAQSSGPNVDR